MVDALVTFKDNAGRRWYASASISMASAAEAGQTPAALDLGSPQAEEMGLRVVKFQFIKPVPAEHIEPPEHVVGEMIAEKGL
jgi:hypothetical protein